MILRRVAVNANSILSLGKFRLSVLQSVLRLPGFRQSI